MASRFTELDCWQLSNELKLALYEIARRPAVVADFKYRDQLTDAAASAPRNIAEGFGRRTDPQFAQFLDVAGGSSMECQNHLRDGVDRVTSLLRNPSDSSSSRNVPEEQSLALSAT